MSTATTSGNWPSISTTPPNLDGLGTAHVTWGIPAGSKSGYVFRGGDVEVRTDGTESVFHPE